MKGVNITLDESVWRIVAGCQLEGEKILCWFSEYAKKWRSTNHCCVIYKSKEMYFVQSWL